MRKTVGTPHVLWIFEEWLGIEIANLSPDLAIVTGGIERVDSTDATNTVLQIRPKRLKAVANGRKNTHTGDDYSALGHNDILEVETWKPQLLPIPTFCTVWKSFPSVRIEGAMMISVCWNSGRLRAPTLPMQVVIAPTRFWLPSSTSAGPNRICFNEPVAPTLMRVPRGRLACGVAMPQ